MLLSGVPAPADERRQRSASALSAQRRSASAPGTNGGRRQALLGRLTRGSKWRALREPAHGG